MGLRHSEMEEFKDKAKRLKLLSKNRPKLEQARAAIRKERDAALIEVASLKRQADARLKK